MIWITNLKKIVHKSIKNVFNKNHGNLKIFYNFPEIKKSWLPGTFLLRIFKTRETLARILKNIDIHSVEESSILEKVINSKSERNAFQFHVSEVL